MLYGPRDVRFEERPDPTIVEPTDALIRLPLSCVCGSDLWPYRGIAPIDGPTPMGHEYVGIVEEVGSEVRLIEPGQFVVGSFFASDNTCEICRAGYHSSCINRQPGAPTGAQAEYARIPLADGTLVATPGMPSGGHDPQPAGGLRRARHRLVRRRGGRGRSGKDGGGRRRRRRRPARGACCQAARRGADHRDEPPRVPPAARPGVRRDRDRDRARRGGRGTDQGAHRAGSARTRSSRPSARRSR